MITTDSYLCLLCYNKVGWYVGANILDEDVACKFRAQDFYLWYHTQYHHNLEESQFEQKPYCTIPVDA
jgi:hypothetical protein